MPYKHFSMSRLLLTIGLALLITSLKAQVWVPDNGDGTYKNPVIYADYSDPDVIRVGTDYYMVASSFTCQPGIPVMHSKDLVNWTIINYVYKRLPLDRYNEPQHGQGSWAPSIRYHNHKFYVYFCTPEDGLFMASTANPSDRWDLTLVQKIANWEDPCPFWDSDGKAYLLHGRVGAGPAILHKMSPDGTRLLDNGKVIFHNPERQPTLEGFKFMDKRDGYYYFSAPAGGVGKGWQSVFRAKNIYGPYEDKVVLHQGSTGINGPHQGGLVETQTGEWWFMHFQDQGAYGRVVHLQPATWKNGWPVIGINDHGDGIGEPVLTYKKPNVGKTYPIATPQTSDEFNQGPLGLQWQWQAAPLKSWYNLNAKFGYMRLFATAVPTDSASLLYAGSLLLQKFTAPAFAATTKVELHLNIDGERAGLTVMGNYYTCLCVERRAGRNKLVLYDGKKTARINPPHELASVDLNEISTAWLSVRVAADATCKYAYSTDGKTYHLIGGSAYPIEKGGWIGAKTGIFCISSNLKSTNKDYADFDFFRVSR